MLTVILLYAASFAFQMLMAFFAALSFAVLFNAPRSELVFCGLAGIISWGVYLIARDLGGSLTVASFLGALAVTPFCHMLAKKRKTIVTIFLISGIIPLVPGAGIYSTMYNIIVGNAVQAAAQGMETLKLAGVIALGIIIVLTIQRAAVLYSNSSLKRNI